MAFTAGLKLLATWFPPARRGFGVGIFMTATSLGTVIANALVPSLIKAAGWESAYRSFGVGTIVIAVVCGLLLGLIGFGALWGSSGVVTWSNTLMVTGQGIDPVDAGVVLVLYAGIAIAVKPLVGWVIDRLGLGRLCHARPRSVRRRGAGCSHPRTPDRSARPD